MTTRGISDLFSRLGEEGVEDFLAGSGVLRLSEGENLGMRLFLCEDVDVVVGVEERASGDGARLEPKIIRIYQLLEVVKTLKRQ